MLLIGTRTVAAGLLLVAFATGGNSAPVPLGRAKDEKALAALAEKLHGPWVGGPCEGTITFRADRTYEWTGIGPGGDYHSGTWALCGEPTAPVLLLTCKASVAELRAGETVELPVVRMDEKGFALKSSEAEAPQNFVRAKCGTKP